MSLDDFLWTIFWSAFFMSFAYVRAKLSALQFRRALDRERRARYEKSSDVKSMVMR